MADENGDVKQADLEDSNIAGIGSQENRDLRKEAAASDPNFKGAGTKPGLEVWRVENRRTESDTPDFGVRRWPKEQYGEFYTGDSYIALKTYQVKDPETGKLTDKLAWDVHFWLGNESSQDEIGVAAYKTVELDDLLDDGPIQHRETQGHESALFQTYFAEIVYLEGGIASGFRKVKPEEYVPRLLQVRKTKKTIRAFQVPVAANSMNHGDCFILDVGTHIYCWNGEEANAFEKSKAGTLASNMITSRHGKCKKGYIDDGKFWEFLNGTEDDVKEAKDGEPVQEDINVDNCQLWRLSDASGKIDFSKEEEGKLSYEMLDSNDVFIVDAQIEIYIWIGSGASSTEKSQAMKHAVDYLEQTGRPTYLPITSVVEGQMNLVFGTIMG